jgi:hypothetical protein
VRPIDHFRDWADGMQVEIQDGDQSCEQVPWHMSMRFISCLTKAQDHKTEIGDQSTLSG